MARKKRKAAPEPAPATPASTVPKKARCPRCRTEFTYTSVKEHKPFPFCSARCRDVDLGNWLTGKYVVPGEPLPENTESTDLPAEYHDDGT